ncbi:MAG TPA: hypothetical protein VMU78_08470, partial [Methylocella sp.]|nr:hypothetical protein [Methylocella sp.]
MFNSTIIDVAIGMVLSFLAVSLAASAITEAFSSVLKLREKTLLKGVQDLLNDTHFTGLARDLYNHALVNPLASGTAKKIKDFKHTPAYIDSRQFALAFYNALEKKTPQAAAGQTPSADDVIGKITDPQLRTAMEALWDISAKDADAFKHNIAVWFDNSMDRLTGWYKRWTQWMSFVVALAIAALFNVNVLYESAQIWTRPAVITDLAALHFEAGGEAMKPDQAATTASSLFNALEPAFLIGWVKGPEPHDWQSWYIAIASWILVAGATLFGASFWIDILQNITQLKGTG